MKSHSTQANMFRSSETCKTARVHVIGIGDAGCRVASGIRTQIRRGVDVTCIDTDSTSLDRSQSDRNLLLGASTLRGFGSGGDVDAVAAAAGDQSEAVHKIAAGAETVILIAGLAGGTGAGAAPVIAGIARSKGAHVISIGISPFEFEPIGAHLLAADTLNRLGKTSDSVLEMRRYSGKEEDLEQITLAGALSADRRYTASVISFIARIAAEDPQQLGVNSGHLRSVLRDGATAIFGTGAGHGHTGAVEATRSCLDRALSNQPSSAVIERAIVLVEAGPDLPVSHIATVTAAIEAGIGTDAELHATVSRSRLMSGSVRVSLIGSLRKTRRPLVVGQSRTRRAGGTEVLTASSLLSVSLN